MVTSRSVLQLVSKSTDLETANTVYLLYLLRNAD